MAIQNFPFTPGATTGAGTTGKLPKWATASTLTDSIVSESGALLTTAGTHLSAVGAVSAPSYGYTGEANTGWYRSSAGVAGLSILGTLRWSVSASTATMAAGVTSTNTGIYLTGSINDFLQYDIQNTSTGTSAQTTYSITADNGSATSGFMSININNSTFTAVNAYSIGVANDTSALGSGNDMYVANASTTKDIIFSLGKVASPFFDEFMRISRSLLQTVFTGTNGIRCIAAATQDAMVIKGRAGGTTNLTATLTPGILSASRTYTYPDATGTIALAATTLAGYGITDGTSTSVGTAGTIPKYTGAGAIGNSLLIDNIGTGALTLVKTGTTARQATFQDLAQTVAALEATQVFTGADTFRNAAGIRSEAASTQDAVILAGRAGGSTSLGITLTPATLTASATQTLQNVAGVQSLCTFTGTADATVANTTAETSIVPTGVGTVTLPANFLIAGKTIRVTITGYCGSTSLPTWSLKIKFGSTVLATTTAFSATVSANSGFIITGLITCRTTGVSGTIVAGGFFSYDAISSGHNFVKTTTTTVDTTATQLVDVSMTWGTANAANTITSQALTIEALN